VEIRDNTAIPTDPLQNQYPEGEEPRDLRSPGLNKKDRLIHRQFRNRTENTIFHRRVLASTVSGWSTAEEIDPLCRGVPLSRYHGQKKIRGKNPVDQGGKNRNAIIACQRGDTPRGGSGGEPENETERR